MALRYQNLHAPTREFESGKDVGVHVYSCMRLSCLFLDLLVFFLSKTPVL